MVTPVARPSMPSVRFTELTQPTMTKAAKIIYTTHGSTRWVLKKGIYRLGTQHALVAHQAQEGHGSRQLQQELLGSGEAGVLVVLHLLIVVDIADDAEHQGEHIDIQVGEVPLQHALPAQDQNGNADRR